MAKESGIHDKSPPRHWQCGDYRLPIGERTLIMGVVNVTPDSFSDGGLFIEADRAIAHGHNLIEAGADILDIGGESSRPGSEPVPETIEKERILPVIEGLRDCGIPLSVDTWKAGVAEAACKTGASIINDIKALQSDPQMAHVAAKLRTGVVLMHMRGTPATMQSLTDYQDPIGEIHDFLRDVANGAIQAGVSPDAIAIDPGIGFGKTVEQNIAIIRHLRDFRNLNYPLLIGTSRKSFLGHLTGQSVENRIPATVSSVVCAIAHGVDIVRVHDIAFIRDAVKVADAIERGIE